MKVYLDACCLNRLTDDQTQIRIRLEQRFALHLQFICEYFLNTFASRGASKLIAATDLEAAGRL